MSSYNYPLVFEDDSFIFFQDSSHDCTVIKDFLSCYGENSGKVVNFDKSSILFSQNIEEGVTSHICSSLGVSVCVNNSKYLGLLLIIGRNKKEVFNFVKEKHGKGFKDGRIRCFQG